MPDSTNPDAPHDLLAGTLAKASPKTSDRLPMPGEARHFESAPSQPPPAGRGNSLGEEPKSTALGEGAGGVVPAPQTMAMADLTGIPGVLCREVGGLSWGGPPRCVEELDQIPSPYLQRILQPAKNGMMLEFSRGCLFGCGYCTWNADKRLRHVSAARIKSEVKWALKEGHRAITVNDSALNYDTNALHAKVDAIKAADPKGRIKLTYNLRLDQIDDEQIALLKRLPTHMVLLGIETLNPAAMVDVDRDFMAIDEIHERLSKLILNVRSPVVSIVLGLPGDSEEGFRSTFEKLLSWTYPYSTSGTQVVGAVLVSLLQVYRGSELWKRRDELGLHFHRPGIPYLTESKSWSAGALARTKRYIVDRMNQHPSHVKAAEAIALMESLGEGDPWLRRSRIKALFSGWPENSTRKGWTFTAMGFMRDRGDCYSLRFRWCAGGEARVVLYRRITTTRGENQTRLFSLSVQELPGCKASKETRAALLKDVQQLLLEGEEQVARQAAKRKG